MTWITIQIHIFVSSKFQKRHLSTTSDYIVLIRYSELEPYKLQWLQILDSNSKTFTAKTLPWYGTIDPTLLSGLY